jgi:hypothetical protein
VRPSPRISTGGWAALSADLAAGAAETFFPSAMVVTVYPRIRDLEDRGDGAGPDAPQSSEAM